MNSDIGHIKMIANVYKTRLTPPSSPSMSNIP